MNFVVKLNITSFDSLSGFFIEYGVCRKDLLITNEYLIAPHADVKKLPCDVLFQEQFGAGEPSDEIVDAMIGALSGKEYDRIIAIGGGSVIDIAKLFVFGDGLTCEKIFAEGANLQRKRGLIIVPTTCGTGSEVTSISIVEFKKKQTKLGLNIPALFADTAVLIPSLLSTLPYEVFATSSIDALIHAVESHVSPKANEFTRTFGYRAIELILHGYQELDKKGGKKEIPRDTYPFLAASVMSGIAFGNAGVGAVHALGYPLGGIYHVPHGKANYMVFEKVFAAYLAKKADLEALQYALASALGCPESKALEKMFELIEKIYPNEPIGKLGVNEEKCAQMAESVIKNQQRLLVNNPIELTVQDVREIYISCL